MLESGEKAASATSSGNVKKFMMGSSISRSTARTYASRAVVR